MQEKESKSGIESEQNSSEATVLSIVRLGSLTVLFLSVSLTLMSIVDDISVSGAVKKETLISGIALFVVSIAMTTWTYILER